MAKKVKEIEIEQEEMQSLVEQGLETDDYSENIADIEEEAEKLGYEVSSEMKGLLKEFKEINKKKKKIVNFTLDRVCYPTGIVSLDMMLGKDVPSKDNPEVIIKNRGIRDGSLIALGGKTHLGKSVLSAVIAGNIVRPFIKKGLPSWVEYFTPEEGMEPLWLQSCLGLGLDAEEKGFVRITHRHTENTSSEGFARLIHSLYQVKMENKEKFTYETVNMRGQKVKKLVPTVLIIDSWSNLCSTTLLKNEEEANPMFHARRNGINGMFIEQVRPLMLEANIITFGIIHIGEKLNVGYDSRAYIALGREVTLSGGKKFHYETDLGLLLHKIIYKNDEDMYKETGINVPNTKAVEAKIYKNRSNMFDDNSKFALVYDPSVGFNPVLSMMCDALGQYNIFENKGAYYNLEGYPDERFYKKDIYKKFLEEKDFRTRYAEAYKHKFSKYLTFIDNVDEVEQNTKLLDDIFN